MRVWCRRDRSHAWSAGGGRISFPTRISPSLPARHTLVRGFVQCNNNCTVAASRVDDIIRFRRNLSSCKAYIYRYKDAIL